MTQLLKSHSVLPLTFGGASISGEGGGYGFGQISEDDSLNLLSHAFDLGFRIFDTAPIYGFGLSEKRIGKAFKSKREKVFIVNKSGVSWHSNKRVNMSNDPQITLKMLEQSLNDLQSDFIDLYMIHWPDPRVDIRRALEVLAKAKQQQKILHIGLCNTNLLDLEKAKEIEKIEVVQSQFNFFEHSAQNDLFPYIKEKKIDFMSWGTLDKGILTGHVDSARKFDSADCRSWAPWWKSEDKSLKYKIIELIKPKLLERGYSLLSLALGFNFGFEEVSQAICGARNIEQLDTLVEALNKLPPKNFIIEMQEVAKLCQK